MSQAPDITGTEGERLDATVTVDSTFSNQQTQTIELRVEDGGTVVHTDSQQVTLQDSTDSQQITLSWPTSDGDAGVYDLFIESGQDTIQRLIEVVDTRIVDTFEDGDLAEYGHTSGGNIRTSTSVVFEGTQALEWNGNGGGYAYSVSGLPNYPSAGDTFEFRIYVDGNANQAAAQTYFGVPSLPSGRFAGDYNVILDQGAFRLAGPGLSASTGVGYPSNEWLRVEVDWGVGGTITATLEAADGSALATISDSDTTYTTGGVGVANTNDDGSTQIYRDQWRIL